jgi:TRAP-type C4-dicarboxylate transport system permease small subunit
MRALRLARIAAEAEGLRLRERAQRTAVRVACGMVAMVFIFGVLIFLHIAAWYWIRQSWRQEYAALTLAAADLVLALLLVFLASRSSPSRVEVEALAVRQQALASVGSSLAVSSLGLQLLRLVMNFVRRPRARR